MIGGLPWGSCSGGLRPSTTCRGRRRLAVVRGLDRERFRPVVVGVDRDGRWLLLPAATVGAAVDGDGDGTSGGPAIDDRLTVDADAGIEVGLRRGGALVAVRERAPSADVVERLDVVLPVMHGPYGEDGVLQGHLQALGVPYAGCGVLASAVGMDKVAMRRAFAAEGIPSPPSVWFTERRWRAATDAGRAALAGDGLGWPRFVKPARMGSSIGVSRVTGPDELVRAVEEAFAFDGVVVVERGIEARELLCGVLGDAEDPASSVPSEVKVSGGFSDYAQKYLSAADTVTTPADLPADVTARVRELSVRAFRAIGGHGLARVDFLYEEATGRVYVGEINTMPGFTARSVYARGWAASGVPYGDVLTRLIDLAGGEAAR
ncbi:D-alanine--D-alanine ligase family protein [Actinomadura sp. CNU-125]|uniref:D-alanine--D-alanine ligase family protein n=1 Tax=Actinomadura sp. CNU-125 TaxID=1904961 RepID=UPI000B18B71A|nr:D-alanine--D-alanine ligase family protein [Actinomadura sp. CNU-125]